MIGLAITIVGLLLVVVVVVDVYVTTISMHGGGPVTSRMTDRAWKWAVTRPRTSDRFLEVFGAMLLPGVILTWVLALYAGWVLVFAGHPDAVVDASTLVPADLLDRIYFTGYLITTLGNGELRPDAALWKTLTVLASMTGLMIITLAITYVMPVLTAVMHKRQIARSITAMGATTEELLETAWDGRGFDRLTTHLANLVPELTGLAQEYLAYPVLHFFHSADRDTAIAPAVAVLDDALQLLRYGVAPAHRLDPVTLRATMGGVDVVLDALEIAHIDASDDQPDPPPLAVLDHLGIPRVGDDVYAAAFDRICPRRARLAAFLASDGWQGPDRGEESSWQSGRGR
jgi:hypothetical protein